LPAEMRGEVQEWVEGLVERGIKMNEQEGL
jgi:hypothetical protein